MGGVPTNHFGEVVAPKKRADGTIDQDHVIPGYDSLLPTSIPVIHARFCCSMLAFVCLRAYLTLYSWFTEWQALCGG